MDFVTWARSPWGEDVLTHISWSLFWASLVGGFLFLIAHGGYMLFSRHDKRDPDEVDKMEAERKSLPARIERHSFVARMLITVSFMRPSGRRLAANMQSGGSSQNTLKKLNGAALTTPAGPTDVTHAIGRGSTKDVSTL